MISFLALSLLINNNNKNNNKNKKKEEFCCWQDRIWEAKALYWDRYVVVVVAAARERREREEKQMLIIHHKQTALLVILSQLGCRVPAKRMWLTPVCFVSTLVLILVLVTLFFSFKVDSVTCRIGARDQIVCVCDTCIIIRNFDMVLLFFSLSIDSCQVNPHFSWSYLKPVKF